MLVQARLAQNPGLYPLVRGAKEDPAKTSTVAGGSQEQALSTVGAGLRETRENIAKTRPLLHTIAWEKLVASGAVEGFSARRTGDRWFLHGLPEVGGRPVELLPG